MQSPDKPFFSASSHGASEGVAHLEPPPRPRAHSWSAPLAVPLAGNNIWAVQLAPAAPPTATCVTAGGTECFYRLPALLAKLHLSPITLEREEPSLPNPDPEREWLGLEVSIPRKTFPSLPTPHPATSEFWDSVAELIFLACYFSVRRQKSNSKCSWEVLVIKVSSQHAKKKPKPK